MGNRAMKPKATRAVLEILQASSELGFVMSRTKVAKLLYLADLEYARRTGSQGSDVDWIWYNYGPYDTDLLTIERELEADGSIRCETAAVAVKDERWVENRLVLVEHIQLSDEEVDREFLSIVREMVGDYGGWSATRIKNFTYATPPMIKAQEEERGVSLDIAMVAGRDRQKPHLPNLDKYRKLLRSRPPIDPQQDSSWELDELAAARPSIRRAEKLVS